MVIIAGTGHRPEDCAHDELGVRDRIRLKLEHTINRGLVIDVVISGMASGYDLWLADEALKMGLEVVAARPWAGHKPRVDDRELYQSVIDRAAFVVDVNESVKYPGPWVYHDRNHWMVENATHLLAYWTGKEAGGTYECWTYAEDRVPRYNIINDPPF
jgi:uncharacterized phage-like protein YoqJ